MKPARREFRDKDQLAEALAEAVAANLKADLGPGHRTIRDHHRAKGLADEHRVFLQRPIRRPAL